MYLSGIDMAENIFVTPNVIIFNIYAAGQHESHAFYNFSSMVNRRALMEGFNGRTKTLQYSLNF
jgi:hypothetical protein